MVPVAAPDIAIDRLMVKLPVWPRPTIVMVTMPTNCQLMVLAKVRFGVSIVWTARGC